MIAGGLTLAFLVLMATVWASLTVGYALLGLPPLPHNPYEVLFGVVGGRVAWPWTSTLVAVTIVLLLGAVVGLAAWLFVRLHANTSRVDHASRWLGAGRDVEAMTAAGVQRSAARLGGGALDSPGVPIGKMVAGGRRELWGSWEDMHVDIWGPRTGKTTSRAIPAILSAPGAVLVTSNKRDVVDATRGPRSEVGDVWVFDPQGVAGVPPAKWWWNPLSYVTDEVTAAKLAEHFASNSRTPGSRTDAFFDGNAEDLLAALLLAASLGGRPITQVYKWLTRPTDEEPIGILAEAGFDLLSDQVAGMIFAPEKQRGGIYGSAQRMAACLTTRQVTQWVTPTPGIDRRREFNPAQFVREGGTLYSLSREGRGNAGALVTALTVAVVEAAEEIATFSLGGRLAVPMLGVLDEAANVCRWAELPNLYSHYGSRGIVLMTILQSWSQGVDVWGESGMNKLWSAANIAVYGGGVKEKGFLEMLETLIGTYDRRTSSVSTGRGHRSVSHQLTHERILDVAELSALPRGRAVVFASGSRPTLIETRPWMNGPYAAKVRASIAAYEPGANRPVTRGAAS